MSLNGVKALDLQASGSDLLAKFVRAVEPGGGEPGLAPDRIRVAMLTSGEVVSGENGVAKDSPVLG